MASVNARVSGSVRTAGAGGRSDMDPTAQAGDAVMKRAMLFWAIAIGVLVFMHVGGAQLERG